MIKDNEIISFTPSDFFNHYKDDDKGQAAFDFLVQKAALVMPEGRTAFLRSIVIGEHPKAQEIYTNFLLYREKNINLVDKATGDFYIKEPKHKLLYFIESYLENKIQNIKNEETYSQFVDLKNKFIDVCKNYGRKKGFFSTGHGKVATCIIENLSNLDKFHKEKGPDFQLAVLKCFIIALQNYLEKGSEKFKKLLDQFLTENQNKLNDLKDIQKSYAYPIKLLSQFLISRSENNVSDDSALSLFNNNNETLEDMDFIFV